MKKKSLTKTRVSSNKLGSIIQNGDIDLKIALQHIINKKLIIIATATIGAVLGAILGIGNSTLYTYQGVLQIPTGWEYSTNSPNSILFTYARQEATVNPQLNIRVNWSTRPDNNALTQVVPVILVKVDDVTKDEGQQILTGFINDLSNTTHVKEMNQNARERIDAELNLRAELLAKTIRLPQKYMEITRQEKELLSKIAFEKALEIDKEIVELEKIKTEIGDLQWQEAPLPTKTKAPRPWYLLTLIFALMGTIIGVVVILLSGILKRND